MVTGSNSDKASECFGLSYMGIAKFSALHRRLDIKIYPAEEFPFALLCEIGLRSRVIGR